MAASTDPPAPWEAFPDKPPVSLFWRMGTGEGFFQRWLDVIETYDRDRLGRYLDEHSAPLEWRRVVEMNLAGPRPRDVGQRGGNEG